MTEPTAFAMSKMFTQLAGRPVSFKLALKPSVAKTKPVYGVYTLLPGDAALVVKSDMALIGSLGGAMLGLPHAAVLERIGKTPLEEGLRDAMHEILNIASTLVSVDRRAVLQNMFTDPVFFGEAAQDVFRAPLSTTRFEVSVEGYASGSFAILNG